jgi:hypothetical protein
MQNAPSKLLMLVTTLILVACGGGGGGGGSTATSSVVASTLTFDMQAAFGRMNRQGATFSLVANGTSGTSATDGNCSGTYTFTATPAINPNVFEGNSVLSSTSTDATNLTNCTPATSSGSATHYYDFNYRDLGGSSAGSYNVLSNGFAFPTASRVGDSGAIGTSRYYTDITKAISTGRSDISYAILADSASSAIAAIESKRYDAAGAHTSTTRQRYRIDSAGNLTLLAIDSQSLTGAQIRLVFRAQ